MLPLGGMQIPPDDAYDITSTKMQRYKVIMDSMTSPELDDPSMIGAPGSSGSPGGAPA